MKTIVFTTWCMAMALSVPAADKKVVPIAGKLSQPAADSTQPLVFDSLAAARKAADLVCATYLDTNRRAS